MAFKDIFSQETVHVADMFQVQNGTLRALKKIETPPHYLVGPIDLIHFQPDNKLEVYTKLIARFISVFSDVDVFNQGLINRLQSDGRLTYEEILEYRRTVISSGNINSVIFLPGWSSRDEEVDAYFAAQSSGRLPFLLESSEHQWLRF